MINIFVLCWYKGCMLYPRILIRIRIRTSAGHRIICLCLLQRAQVCLSAHYLPRIIAIRFEWIVYTHISSKLLLALLMFQRKKFMNLSIVLSVGLGGGKTTNKKKVNICQKKIFGSVIRTRSRVKIRARRLTGISTRSRTQIKDRRRTEIRTRGRAGFSTRSRAGFSTRSRTGFGTGVEQSSVLGVERGSVLRVDQGSVLGVEQDSVLGLEYGLVLGEEQGSVLGVDQGSVLGVDQGSVLGVEQC